MDHCQNADILSNEAMSKIMHSEASRRTLGDEHRDTPHGRRRASGSADAAIGF